MFRIGEEIFKAVATELKSASRAINMAMTSKDGFIKPMLLLADKYIYAAWRIAELYRNDDVTMYDVHKKLTQVLGMCVDASIHYPQVSNLSELKDSIDDIIKTIAA